VRRLTVNYRTPREIMDVAADVLAVAAPGVSAPESVRAAGLEPLAVRASSAAALVDAVVSETVRTAGMIGEGRLAVLCAAEQAGAVRAALARAVPELVGPADALPAAAAALDARVAVLTVVDSKGLEFDAVLLVEPAALLAGPTRGLADLYVALTRATRQLTVIHSGDLPDVLARLVPADRAV
jgi:DNA helicase IV